MSYKDLDPQLVRQLRPTDVRHYLRATGWQRMDGMPESIAVFRIDPNGLPEVVVPVASDLGDFVYRRMAEAVADIADHEGREGHQVLEDLLVGAADVVRFQLDDDTVADGTIPFNEGLSLFGGARKALLAAACAVVDPQPFYSRLSRAEATHFINACRMSSERGSFIARVVCPLDTGVSDPMVAQRPLDASEEVDEAPFTRRVTTTLMQALSTLVQSADRDDVDRLITDATTGALSANLCDALLAMQPTGRQAKLKVASTWAAAPGTPPNVLEMVELRQEHFSIVEELANRLRPTLSPEESAFYGTVITLSGTPGTDGEIEGESTLQIQDGEDLIKVRVVLNAEDYRKAAQAHIENKAVKIWGLLRRRARIHQMIRYQRFEIIEDDNRQ